MAEVDQKSVEPIAPMKTVTSVPELGCITPTTDAGESSLSFQSVSDDDERKELTSAREISCGSPRPAAAPPAPAAAARQGCSVVAFLAVMAFMVLNISMGTLIKWLYMYGQVCTTDASGTTSCQAYTFPFMVTALHMLLSWVICAGIVCRRGTAGVSLGFREQLRKIAPVALVFSVSIAFGNLSLKYIYPSFGQMLASMGPLVTVFMAMALRGKRYNFWTWASMPLICGGLLICSVKEVNYNVMGVVCVAVATILRSVKTVMQEALMDPSQKLDSVSLLFYLAPWAGACLITLSLIFEGWQTVGLLLPWAAEGTTKSGMLHVSILLTISGLNACIMNISGNMVTEYLGAVMHAILGNVKSCAGIAVSAAILGNAVTLPQAVGVCISLAGTWLYQKKGGAVKPPSAGACCHTALPQEERKEEAEGKTFDPDLEAGASDADDESEDPEDCRPSRLGKSAAP